MNKHYSRKSSFIICFIAYVAAIAVAGWFLDYYKSSMNGLYLLLLADILATTVVFGFSIAFGNSSLYDPYWSVAPPLMAWYWIQNGYPSATGYLMLAVILIWAVRLTYNWARGWQGLKHEDWRYGMLREKKPRLYPITNFAGIHLFPTIMVFLGMLPVYFAVSKVSEHVNFPIFILGMLISIGATAIQLVADEQMRNFRISAKPGVFINSGLWKYSRHPNYFGEILFWMGLCVMQMAIAPEYWWTAIGFVSMLLMFLLASIPMMETKNRNSKHGYDAYIKRVSILIPWPTKKDGASTQIK